MEVVDWSEVLDYRFPPGTLQYSVNMLLGTRRVRRLHLTPCVKANNIFVKITEPKRCSYLG
jgi:hypothetical protein